MNFREQGHAIIDVLADYLENISTNTQSIPVQEQPNELLEIWQQDFQSKNDLENTFQKVLQHSIQVQHPNFIGHQMANPLPHQVLTNALIATINGSTAIYECGATGLAMEKIVVDFFLEKFGFGSNSNANGLMVSGGSIGNLTALLAARQAKSNYDVITNGSNNDLAVMVSEEAHYCVSRSVQIMGMGEKNVIKIPTDDELRIMPEQLEILYQKAIREGKTVIAVVGNACSTSTGTYDPLEIMADFCKKYNLWFHLDGAHGAPVVLTDKYKHLMKGAERADSIVMDFHKMLLTPALTTLVVFKNGNTSHESFAQKADYLLTQTHEWYQGANRTIECTRTMKSIRVYMLLKYFGEKKLNEYVTKMYDLGQFLAEEVNRRPNFELATPPDGNIVCFRYLPQNDENIDVFNRRLRQAMVDDGTFYIAQTVIKGRAFLRCTVINRLTEQQNIIGMLDKLEDLAKRF